MGFFHLILCDNSKYVLIIFLGEAVTTPKQISNKGATHGISACKYNAN